MVISNATDENVGYVVSEQPVDCAPPATRQGELAAGESATVEDLQTALCKVCLTPGSKPDWSDLTWVRRNVAHDAAIRFIAGEFGERHIELASSNNG